MIDVTLITPTNNRPAGIALCERWMARQTFAGSVQWIVADGGTEPPAMTMRQEHVTRTVSNETGAENLALNLLAAIPRVRGRSVLIIEDDDFYRPEHVASIASRLDKGAMMAGDCRQHYYNVKHRMYRTFNNTGASLCQTGMRAEWLPRFEEIIRWCLERKSYGIDTWTWRTAMTRRVSLAISTGLNHVIGIKGVPGSIGLGCGHRVIERPAGWAHDQSAAKLREWVGSDAAVYEPLYENHCDPVSR